MNAEHEEKWHRFMEAFAERRMVLDLGSGRFYASRPLDLTIGR